MPKSDLISLKLDSPDPLPLGLRERGKQERLRRIKQAAFDVFRTQGYEGANTREIARLADVSIGTLFVYAKDKRDLLFLVLNEDLDRISQMSIAAVKPEGSVAERIVALLAPIYDYFAQEPALARTVLREVAAIDQRPDTGGEQAQRFAARMNRWQRAITAIINDASRKGQFHIGKDANVLGRALFSAHLGEVRYWLQQDEPEAKAGVRDLARVVKVIVGTRERLSQC